MPLDKFGAPLGKCEACDRQSAEVIESRPNKIATRRRKRCLHCQHRFTTYELSAKEFERLTSAVDALSKVRKALGAPVAIPAHVEPPCSSCKFASRHGCSFDYPEYDTIDAIDCVQYEQGT